MRKYGILLLSIYIYYIIITSYYTTTPQKRHHTSTRQCAGFAWHPPSARDVTLDVTHPFRSTIDTP